MVNIDIDKPPHHGQIWQDNSNLFTKIYHFTLKGSAQMKYTTLNGDTNKDKYSTTPPQPI